MKILLLVSALWIVMFFGHSDGAYVTRKLGDCPKNGYKTAVYDCDEKCIIKSATVRFQKGGNVDLVGRDGRRLFTPLLCGRKCFCRGFTRRRNFEKCFKKKGSRIRKRTVSFVMKCKKMSRNVRFSVHGNIKPRKTIKPKVLELKIPDMTRKERKFFKVRCDGNCDPKDHFYGYFNDGGQLDIRMSTSNRLKDIATCHLPCLCNTRSYKIHAKCGRLSWTTLSVSSFYIMVEAGRDTKNLRLYQKIDNFLSIDPFTPDSTCVCTGDKMTGTCDRDGNCECQSGFYLKRDRCST